MRQFLATAALLSALLVPAAARATLRRRDAQPLDSPAGRCSSGAHGDRPLWMTSPSALRA